MNRAMNSLAKKDQAALLTRERKLRRTGEWGEWITLDQWRNWNFVPIAPGDLLWVREAFRGDKGYDSTPPREWSHWPVHYEADGEPDPNDEIGMNGRLRPGMFMPRWASRLTLRVTDVRVQRVQNITEEDAKEEGVGPLKPVPGRPDLMWVHHGGERYSAPGYAFRELWDSLNAKRGFGWDQNPWVAAYTFEVIRQNVDEVAA